MMLHPGRGFKCVRLNRKQKRHPKMTPLLYEIYKLRTLEHLLDEGGFTALRLVGGDDRLCETLLALC